MWRIMTWIDMGDHGGLYIFLWYLMAMMRIDQTWLGNPWTQWADWHVGHGRHWRAHTLVENHAIPTSTTGNLEFTNFNFGNWIGKPGFSLSFLCDFPWSTRDWLRIIADTWLYGYGSIPINTIFRGLFTSIYQLFWCELQGYKVLTHPHIILVNFEDSVWKKHGWRERLQGTPPYFAPGPCADSGRHGGLVPGLGSLAKGGQGSWYLMVSGLVYESGGIPWYTLKFPCLYGVL